MAEQEDGNQTEQDKQDDDIGKTMVALEDVFLRTNQCYAPWGIRYGTIADETGLTIHINTHTTLLSTNHLITQGDNVLMLLCIGGIENGLIDQSGGVRMYKEMSLRT